eukprot:4141260-Lingulodinium_polyedra.AAC.1
MACPRPARPASAPRRVARAKGGTRMPRCRTRGHTGATRWARRRKTRTSQAPRGWHVLLRATPAR